MLSSFVVLACVIASTLGAVVPATPDLAFTTSTFSGLTCRNFTTGASAGCTAIANIAGDELCGTNVFPAQSEGCFITVDTGNTEFANVFPFASVGVNNAIGVIGIDGANPGAVPNGDNAALNFAPDTVLAGNAGASDNVAGFLLPGGSFFVNAIGVIDSRVNYRITVDVCASNVTTTGDVTLTLIVGTTDLATAASFAGTVEVDIDVRAIGTSIAVGNGRQATVSFATAGQTANCTSVAVEFRHYELFDHVGVEGISAQLDFAAGGDGAVFFDNFAIEQADLIATAPNNILECTKVFVNEIDFFVVNEEPQAPELSTNAVELAGPVGFPLKDWKVVLFDGLTGSSYLAGSFTEDQKIPDNPVNNGMNGQIGLLTLTFASGLMNAESNKADGVAIFDDNNNLIQFLCYGGPDSMTFETMAATLSPAPGVNVMSTCTHVVDIAGVFLNDTSDAQTLSNRGCGECAEDFDFELTTPTHGANRDDVGSNGLAMIADMNAGMSNTNQVFCSDIDLDGYWGGRSFFLPNGVGLIGNDNDNDRCMCGGNDCQPRYAHVHPGASEPFCDGMVTNCVGSSANLATEEMDMDSDGRIPCDGDCDDWKESKAGDAEHVVGNVYYPNLAAAFNITIGAQCPDDVINGVAMAELNECTDCNEGPITVSGAAFVEICDGRDNDCSGQIDDPFLPFVAHYPDNDNDGFGDAKADQSNLNMLASCHFPPNVPAINRTYPLFWAPNFDDCNDNNEFVNPGVTFDGCVLATDVGLDNDCDGDVDEDAIDSDGDGFPDQNCTAATVGIASLPSDCNDTNPFIHPGAKEICDGFDNDCDTSNDFDKMSPQERLDNDIDGDLYIRCVPVTNAPLNLNGFFLGEANIDCNDSNPLTNPGIASDPCGDGQDNDCDKMIDEDQFVDADSDTFPTIQCFTSSVPNHENAPDCDDGNAAVFPGAPELCDGVLNNCTAGTIPENEADADMDGFLSCFCEPATLDLTKCDCNDTVPAINPTANDFYFDCDGIDNNCNGQIDETAQPKDDVDGDGFPGKLCDTPNSPFADNRLDCEDTDASFNPNVVEVCDGLDKNCDGKLVVEINGVLVSENDTDGDGFFACGTQAVGDSNQFDCDDNDPLINPDAPDPCENACGIGGVRDSLVLVDTDVICTRDCQSTTNDKGTDNNCDGIIDNDFTDADKDGHASHLCLSSESPQFNGANGKGCADCNDNQMMSFPLNPEECDGIDNDCLDGVPANEADTDGDGFRKCNNDCNDMDMNINPNAEEICTALAADALDRNCDGFLNNKFEDKDGDGFPLITCPTATGNASREADCNDNNPNVHPDAIELCNGIDDNCDDKFFEGGEIDHDGDGFLACAECDDTRKDINPGVQVDICDGFDNDCDKIIDEDAGVDNDNDLSPAETCSTAPVGHFARNAKDCDDNDASASPLNKEDDPRFRGDDGFGDYKDNNCNNEVDEGLPRLVGKVDVKVVKHKYESSSSADAHPHAVVIIALKNIGDGAAKEVATKGQIHLPKHAQFVEKSFGGDEFSVHIDAQGHFLWSQTLINAGETKSIKIDVALAHAGDHGHIHVVAQITDVLGFQPNVIFTI